MGLTPLLERRPEGLPAEGLVPPGDRRAGLAVEDPVDGARLVAQPGEPLLEPWSTSTGRPEAVSRTPPSSICALRSGRVVTSPALGLRAEGARERIFGRPKRAVPRVTMVELSTRSSTGTRIAEGVGAAVRAATSAGDWTNDAARNPDITATATSATTPNRTMLRFLSKGPLSERGYVARGGRRRFEISESDVALYCTVRANISFSIRSSTGSKYFSSYSNVLTATRRS
jgi:hypothetical protein